MKESTPGAVEKTPGEPMRLKTDSGEVMLDSKIFLEQQLGVTKWVRFQAEEFNENFETVAPGQIIDHFNYKMPNHVPGKQYIVMKIEDEINRAPGSLPLLTPEGAFVVECVEMVHDIQDSLEDRFFEHSLKGIDKATLKDRIKDRYKVGDEEIAQKGIHYTRFRVVKTPDEVKAMLQKQQ